jgi:hypothetical protein
VLCVNKWAGIACADPSRWPPSSLRVQSCCQPRVGKVWRSLDTALTVDFEAFDTFIESLSAAQRRKGRERAPHGTVVRGPKRCAQTSATSLLLSESNPMTRKPHTAQQSLIRVNNIPSPEGLCSWLSVTGFSLWCGCRSMQR